MLSKNIETRIVAGGELHSLLRSVKGFSDLSPTDLMCIGDVEQLDIPKSENIYSEGEFGRSFWILVEGHVQIHKREPDGSRTLVGDLHSGESFGEVGLLGGVESVQATCTALADSRILRVQPEAFWRLMATCPTVRRMILQNMSHRLSSYTAVQLQREKLVSLGMLAAGLMHELNNPGSAAKRAASQLRENLQALPEICVRLSQNAMSGEQMECLRHLQQEVVEHARPAPLNSLEEADAEDELTAWLEGLGVADAWKLSPTLVAAGWRRQDMECAQGSFPPEALAQTLHWLQNLVASMQSLTTIEESLSRVTELVLAVKRYAYEDKSSLHEVNVHEGLQSTLTILGHKLRHKQLTVEKRFASGLPVIKSCGRGLNQVWTNLLDNAIDAAPQGSVITVRTWVEEGFLCVAILDRGPGIPEEEQPHIFQPFYTTKPVGIGTGLGLDIAYRIVTGQYYGTLTFTSVPGATEFVVRLPLGS